MKQCLHLLVFALLALPGFAQVQNFIVAKRGELTVARDKFDGAVHFENTDSAKVFQQAVDMMGASGGGAIEVLAGTYTLERPVALRSYIALTGSGKATRFQLGETNAKEKGTLFLLEKADNCTLADFACVGVPSHANSHAIATLESGFATIRNLFLVNFSGCGLHLKLSFACKIDNIVTARNGRAGVLIERNGWTPGGVFVPNKLIGCYSYFEEGHGFEFDRAICQDIVGCVVYLAKKHGIYMHDGTSNLISGNRIFMCYGSGIVMEANHEMNISSNICGWNHGVNLMLDHCVWATVTGNEFIDSGGRRDPQLSVHLKRGTKSVQITGNAIFNWWDNQIMKGGIYEEADCLENQITDNIINYYKEEAVSSRGKNSVAVYNLALPHAYGDPHKGPEIPNVPPEKIKLHMDLDDAKKRAEEYFAVLMKDLLGG
jgi:parallel beta-helix repeat protein